MKGVVNSLNDYLLYKFAFNIFVAIKIAGFLLKR